MEIRTLIDDILRYEKKYNKNSIEILHSKNNFELDKWQKSVTKALFYGVSILDINKQKPLNLYSFKSILNIEEKINSIDDKKNSLVIISDQFVKYEAVMKLCNEKNIHILLLTNKRKNFDLDNKYKYSFIDWAIDFKKKSILRKDVIKYL